MATLKIQEHSIAKAGQDLVTGVVYFDLGSQQFPEKCWDDFVVVVVGWWLPELLSLIEGTKTHARFRFMDGPYALGIHAKSPTAWLLQCLEGSPSRVTYECECSAVEFSVSVVRAAIRLRTICATNEWRSSDVDALDQCISIARLLKIS